MFTLDETRPVWVEIDLDNLAHNIREVRKHTREDSLVTAVVKANGYGHGSVEISRTFLDNGADRLAVALLSEAIELRKGNIKEPILILGYTPTVQYEKVLENNIIQTIYNYEDAKALSRKAVELNKKATIHIKIDSGMGRIGLLPTEESIEEVINISELPNIYIEGIFTHFAKADEIDKSHVRGQYEKYTDFVNAIEKRGLIIPIKHVSNSASIIDLPDFNLNMVRGGIMIYGYYPSDDVDKENIKLKPAMTLKAKISHLKTVPKGTGISYGQIFSTERESIIATIPIGYADGYTRLLTGKAEVFVNGKRAKIVGKICMDQCMIDVTDIENVKLGDEVILFGSEPDCPTVDEIAAKIGTINYEIVCMISRRVPRVYMTNGKIVKIIDYLLD
ncbi:alanine racemase [Tissierella sp.]|uniref:alanine racemase n=1 Tax=Tissierella sp. TaxID=41274 RepID=UPI0028673B10|nr:alanine racemase [Tissierella sp.]MDR7856571.1 alanine racemase [Tissierella sp.]